MDTSKSTSNRNPRENANCVSVWLFWWTIGLFKKGYYKALDTEDLFDPLSTDRSSVLGDRLEKQWRVELRNCEKGNRQPSLLKAIFRTFRFDFFLLVCLKLLDECILRLGIPMLLGALLQYFKPKPMITYENALIYAGGISIAIAVNVITLNQLTFLTGYLGGRVRTAMCSIIYRKALRLSKTALGETAPGKIVNLMASDVYTFDLASVSLHYVWSAPLSAFIVGYFMYTEAGYAGFIGIAVVFVVIFFQACTTKLISKFRLQTSIKTDERMRLMGEIIWGVKMIKMYAWEKPFCTLVELARRLELKAVRKRSYIRSIFMTCNLFTSRIALFGTLVTIMLTGEKLRTEKVFVFSSYFMVLAFSIGSMFVRGVAEVTESLVAVGRLQNFLTFEEFQTSNVIIGPLAVSNGFGNVDSSSRNCHERKETWSVKLDHMTAKWNLHSPETTLQNIHLEIERGKLYIVIGMVGAGKSSLLSTILGELNLLQGNVRVNGEISYASQEAWVFGSSVKQNILFGQDFDRQRYQRVVKTCDLLKDFKQFPQGDQSIVGVRGCSLSDGQRARINLARAIYREADIYLLDDPLSAVDAHVGKHLFKECLQKYLRGKTRILATHQLQFIKEADSIILMDQGRMYQYSDYHKLLNAHPQYSSMITAERAGNVGAGDCPAEVPDLKRRISSTSTTSRPLGTSEGDTDGEEENLTKLDDSMDGTSGSAVKGNLMLRYFQAGSSTFLCVLLTFLFLMTQFVTSLNDYFISMLVEAEESRLYSNDLSREALNSNLDMITNKSSMIIEEDKIPPMGYYTYIYAVIVLSIFVIGTIRSLVFYAVCLSSSQQLHDISFGVLIRTTMRFFDTNPSGRILNCFSRDLGVIDDLLPKTMLEAVQIILTLSGSVIVCCTVNPMILVPLLFISVVFYWIRWIYLKTSQNVKRLEGISRSSVFTHLNATLNGISTIRAYKAQKILVKEFEKFQDVHTSSWYTYISCSMAFAFSLDVCCYVFISLVIFSFLILKESFSGGQVGLVILQLMTMTDTLQWGVRQAAEVTNLMTSVECVLEFADLVPEVNLRDVFSGKRKEELVKSEEKLTLTEPPGWPSAGSVNFQNVYLRYSDEEAPVLKNLTLIVRPSEKVGIVGRTGAGKSSLISALFRLAKVEGSIEIDSIDTGRIALEDLRRHISIIPQDPVLFSGTLRYNMDPFNEFSDEQLWEVLEEMELKDATIATGHGLDNRMLDEGSNYSVGQRQIVCLARAILRNNRVLVLDEATANVDPHTDALIQRTIRTKFAPCTVMTVTNRLNTIMDSDKIIVMDRGHIEEYDHPYALLQNENGPLALLAKEAGPAMYEQLCNVARDAYITKHGDSSNVVLRNSTTF